MPNHPPLTLSVFSSIALDASNSLTDRELQTNYLNHLDRTAEIAALLSQITDRDLALHIIDLALEVDLGLGASLIGHLATDFQATAIQKINDLDICIDLSIALWAKTKSKLALPYLQDIVIFKRRYRDLSEYTISTAWGGIRDIELDLFIALYLEDIYDVRRNVHSKAVEVLADIAPVEAIEVFGSITSNLCRDDDWAVNCRVSAIEGLKNIGTPEAIDCLRTMLARCKCSWSRDYGISALGFVAEPPMLEHLIYLLYLPHEYVHRSIEYPESERYYSEEANSLCMNAIEAWEKVGGDLAFEVLHRALYWVDILDEYHNPVNKIVSVLLRLDRDRTLTALEGAIHSYDPAVRKRAAMALGVWDIEERDIYGNLLSDPNLLCLDDRNLLILLDAIEEPDLSVRFQIALSLEEIYSAYIPDEELSIRASQELKDIANLKTREILIDCISHPDRQIADRAIQKLALHYTNTNEILIPYLDRTSDRNILFIISLLEPSTNSAHLDILLRYLKNDDVRIRARAIENLGNAGDDRLLPILVSYLSDRELIIRVAAVRGIVWLGSISTLPILLELAANRELVSIVIRELSYCGYEEDCLRVLKVFQNNIALTQHFINVAETTLIEMVMNILDAEDDYRNQNGLIIQLGLISNSDRAVDAIECVMKSDKCNYDIEDDGVDALASIGTDRAISALLSLLPNEYVLGVRFV